MLSYVLRRFLSSALRQQTFHKDCRGRPEASNDYCYGLYQVAARMSDANLPTVQLDEGVLSPLQAAGSSAAEGEGLQTSE